MNTQGPRPGTQGTGPQGTDPDNGSEDKGKRNKKSGKKWAEIGRSAMNVAAVIGIVAVAVTLVAQHYFQTEELRLMRRELQTISALTQTTAEKVDALRMPAPMPMAAKSSEDALEIHVDEAGNGRMMLRCEFDVNNPLTLDETVIRAVADRLCRGVEKGKVTHSWRVLPDGKPQGGAPAPVQPRR